MTFEDFKGHQDRLLADPEFDASFDQLIDMTKATKLNMSPQEGRILAERRVVSPKSRRALVATEAHIFAFGRMMEIYHEQLGIARVFYSMDEALKWLER